MLIALLLAAVVAQGSEAAQPSWPPPKVSVHTPPPLIAVTDSPPPPVLVIQPPAIRPAPPPPAPRVVRPPQPRGNAQSLIGVEDYPQSALAAWQQGRVQFLLDVGANGRVTGCTITRSSGSSALDSTTCRLMRSRSRFTPAIDSNGNPAAGRVAQEVEWSLPGPQPAAK